MDQSTSLQDQDEVWLAKLAMLGCHVSQFATYYFVYNETGQLVNASQNLSGAAMEAIERIQLKAEQRT